MMFIFDTDTPITKVIPNLIKKYDECGVIRYIAPGSANAWKCITISEARAIQATNGKIKLGLVYETNGKPRGTATGANDGVYASLMLSRFGVPKGGFLAYTSDEDTPNNLVAVGQAFEAFFDQLKDKDGYMVNRVAYAAGATYDYLLSKGFIDSKGRWPTQSMGFNKTRADIIAGDYDLRQMLPMRVFDLDTDPEELHPGVTLDDLGFFIPNIPAPVLPDFVFPHTASSDDVIALQTALNYKNNAGLTIDGIYGAATTTAVDNFQKAHNLTIDGLAGHETITTLKGLS